MGWGDNESGGWDSNTNPYAPGYVSNTRLPGGGSSDVAIDPSGGAGQDVYYRDPNKGQVRPGNMPSPSNPTGGYTYGSPSSTGNAFSGSTGGSSGSGTTPPATTDLPYRIGDIQYDPQTGNVYMIRRDPNFPSKEIGMDLVGTIGNGLRADYQVTPTTTNMTPDQVPGSPAPPGRPAPADPSTGRGGYPIVPGTPAVPGSRGGGLVQGVPGVPSPLSSDAATSTGIVAPVGVPGGGTSAAPNAFDGNTPGARGGDTPTGAAAPPLPTNRPGGVLTTNGPQAFNWNTQPGSAWQMGIMPNTFNTDIQGLVTKTGLPADILGSTMRQLVTNAQQNLQQNDRNQRLSQSRFLTGVGRVNAGFTPVGF